MQKLINGNKLSIKFRTQSERIYNMKKVLFLSIFTISLFACQQKRNLEQNMLGSWETTFINIKMPTANQSDSLRTYQDDFSQPNAIKAQSNYKKDSTFTAWYQNGNNKQNESEGKWHCKQDSLFVEYDYQGRTVKTGYKITITKEGFQAKSIYDWDNDGEKDDTLLMRSKRIRLK